MSSPATRGEVSAGGVVVRFDGAEPCYLLIRDSYRNWGFPKGHLKDGDLLPAYNERAAALVRQLDGYSRPAEYAQTRRERLDVVLFVIEAVAALQQTDAFTSPEAKQKTEEATARAAWNDKVGSYKLCMAMDRTADSYRRQVKASGKEPPLASNTSPCADPGPFAYTPSPITPDAQKPLEASEAHSPPGTAHTPPSTKAMASELQGKK